jgi:hypothetical protein
MSGKNGIFGYGLEVSKGVPDNVSTFTPFATESLQMDRPREANPNLDPSGASPKGELLRATGEGEVTGAADSESWLTMRAHHHGHYEPPTEVVAGEVYLWELRAYDETTDTPVSHYLDTLWFRIWRDQLTSPREYTGLWAKVTEFELSVDAHKFAMFKHSLLFLRDRYMGKPEEVAVNVAYTGTWEDRGHRARGDELGPDIFFKVSTGGALGVAELQFGSRFGISITSVTTTATATSTVPHGLATGDEVSVTGATPTEYNVTDTAITVTGLYTFTYPIASVAGAPATGTPIAVSVGATEHTIVNDWMEVYKVDGTRKGTRREPVQIHPVPETGDLFTTGDSWTIPAAAPKPTPVYTERGRLTGTDMELSFDIDGVTKTVTIAKSFSLKHVKPKEAKEGLGSKYLQDIGEPADAQEYWEATFPRTYVDMDFEQALVSDATITCNVKLWGTPIGDTGEEDFASWDLENMSISAAGTTITSAGDLDETVTLRSFPVAGTPLCVEQYQNTVASIDPT